ncbi:MAG: DeoR/GlpR family DNA-binding transcription regulator, partial [Pseudomonadota bacterium]
QLAATGKEAIAEAAAELIPDNCSLMLNIGTTTEQVARALFGRSGLVVISNNVNVINTLMGSRAKELILAGGAVRPSDGAIVGEAAVEFISRFKADFAIVGASALDDDGAVLDYDAREVSVARAILKNARTRILVADATKFERTAPVRICDVADVDYFVTDAAPPDEFQRCAASGDAQIIIAEGAEAFDEAV